MTVFFKNNILSECFILEREIGGGMLHFLIVVCNGGPSCRHSWKCAQARMYKGEKMQNTWKPVPPRRQSNTVSALVFLLLVFFLLLCSHWGCGKMFQLTGAAPKHCLPSILDKAAGHWSSWTPDKIEQQVEMHRQKSVTILQMSTRPRKKTEI